MQLTKEDLKDLRVGLKNHYGSVKKIAEEAEVSYGFVRMVLRGQRNSRKVISISSRILKEKELERRAMEYTIMQNLKAVQL